MMDKNRFFEHLKTLKMIEIDGSDEYKGLVESGMTATFKHFTEKEARFAAKYLRRWPHIYYARYLNCMFGVSTFRKIDNYTDEIKEVMWEYHRFFHHKYVGLFFYINGKILGLRTDITEGNIKNDFIDSPVSHFDYFSFLGFDDDYGHYPRGRVIYNNKTNEYYLYIDKDYENNQDIIDKVMIYFNLCAYNTLIKTDDHYTHDNL